jgi:hypothetical protein
MYEYNEINIYKNKCSNIVKTNKKKNILIIYVFSYYDELSDTSISINDIHN